MFIWASHLPKKSEYDGIPHRVAIEPLVLAVDAGVESGQPICRIGGRHNELVHLFPDVMRGEVEVVRVPERWMQRFRVLNLFLSVLRLRHGRGSQVAFAIFWANFLCRLKLQLTASPLKY